MGKLIRLEVYNFKSYRGHHEMLFGDAYFTSIIGPNGSGKSNSMDAISFVLGIKSSHLRSSNLKDLIYRGRVLRTSKINADGTATEDADTNGHTNGEANGTNGAHEEDGSEDGRSARTRSQGHDPTTAWVMAVYLDDADEEQKWKRSITSSGSSEYSINGRTVTSKEYNAALEAEDILIKARNFLVFQGDVEAIASQSPKDITRLVEQISGSLEHKAEYDELSAQREEAQKATGYKFQEKRKFAHEMKTYRDQKKEVDDYEAKVKERDEAIAEKSLWKLYHFQRVIEESNAEILRCQEELKEHRRGVQKFQERLAEAKRDQAKASRTYSKSEDAIRTKESNIEAKRSDIAPLEASIAHQTSSRDAQATRAAKVKESEEKSTSRIKTLEKEKSLAQKTLKKAEDDAHNLAQKAGRVLSEADLQDYSKLSVEVSKRTSNDANEVRDIERNLKTNNEVANTLRVSVESLEIQSSQLKESLAILQEHRDGRSKEAKEFQNQLATKTQEQNKLKSVRKRALDQHTEQNEKLQRTLNLLKDIEGTIRESDREKAKRGAFKELQRVYGEDVVLGRIADLFEPKEHKFDIAVTTALAPEMDSVVIENEKAAHQCVDYLVENKLPRMKFLPLDKIAIRSVDQRLRSLQKTRLVIDAIDYNAAHERAMSAVCGDTLICENLERARQICFGRQRFNVKAVTYDGAVINKGGTMTGGSGGKKQTTKQFTAAAEAEKLRSEVAKIQSALEALPDTNALDIEEQGLIIEQVRLQTNLEAAKDEIKTLDRNIQDSKKALKNADSDLATAKSQLGKQEAKIGDLREARDSFADEIARVEDEVFANFCARLHYSNIREYVAEQGSLQQELNDKRREFLTQIKRLETQIGKATEDRDMERSRHESLQKAMKKLDKEIAQIRTNKETQENELDQMEAELDQLKESLSTMRETQQEKASLVRQRNLELDAETKKSDVETKKINEHENTKRKTLGERYALLQECKLNEIKIPLVEGSRPIETLPMGDNADEDEDAMDVDEMDTTVLPTAEEKDYGIEVNFDELDEDLQEDGSDETDKKLEQAIRSLTTELEKMQPNMTATRKLDSAITRHEDAEKEHVKAREEERTLSKRFEDVQKQRLAKFNRAFKHISEQIKHVYAELTRSAGSTVVGNAQLTVEHDDEPYLDGLKYTAMPPLKRFRDMEYLSGGEKTIAALALLFAVHSYQPSPFFVLDEVDAALDNLNVARVANYVKRHAKPGMQFIVISLKTGFFMESESLVGIMRDQTENSSRAVTLDLRKYLPN